MSPVEAYILLVVAGIILLALEVFIVGGILGLLGGCCLIAAGVVGFQAFGNAGGLISLLGLLLGTCLLLALWIRLLPDTAIGKKFTLYKRIDEEKANPEQSGLVGQPGEATTDLRPSGIARIGGRRIDVVAESGWIESGAAIRVVEVEGSRVVVREVTAA